MPRTPRHRFFVRVLPAVGLVLLATSVLSLLPARVHIRSPAAGGSKGLLHSAGGVLKAPAEPPSAQRTVIDDERGSIYTTPYGSDMSGLGAYVGNPKTYAFWRMQNNALKIAHGHFHVFRPSDDTSWSYFPYSKLRTFEAREVAAGRPPLFLTATYAGKKRPVLWNWSLGFPAGGQAPTTPSSDWEHGVNVGDPRFVTFWITTYADPILLHRYYDASGHATSRAGGYPNEWIGVDEAAFNYANYGILDDDKHWVDGVRWDAPFPQGAAGMHQMFQRFLAQLKQLRPDIHIMANLGTMDNWSYFQSDFANVDGLMLEDILRGSHEDTSDGARAQVYARYTALTWWASRNKVAVLRAKLDNTLSTYASELRTDYVAYVILRGDNFFFAPELTNTGAEVPPGDYATMKNNLGLPVAAPVDRQATGQSNPGYRLYSRQTQGGIVYLNYTGRTRTIALPAGRTYYDHDGNPVTSLTIPDLAGDYVTYARGSRVAQPQINPRAASFASSQVRVTLQTTTSGAAIHYSTDGSRPTPKSPRYSGPFTVRTGTTIQAQALKAGMLGSFTSAASYRQLHWPPQGKELSSTSACGGDDNIAVGQRAQRREALQEAS